MALATEFEAAGGHAADAPLSRTPKEAWEGTLDTMVGASPETFKRIKPVVECWAGVIVHLGEVGLGHKMKLVNIATLCIGMATFGRSKDQAERKPICVPRDVPHESPMFRTCAANP